LRHHFLNDERPDEARGWSGGEYISRIRQVEEAVSTARDALDNLTQKLHGARAERRHSE
jgi:hypothetical protein